MRISLVIPCYNEADNLPLLLPRCAQLIKSGEVEIILVDNGSTDESPSLLAELLPRYPGCRSIRVEKNLGYGYGILCGLRAAEGGILGWTHADMQTDPADTQHGLALFDFHGDDIFVKGRRYGRSFGDVFFTVGMSVFETLLLGCVLWDINAQPTLFSRAFFEKWKDPPHDFSLDLYAYYFAKHSGMPVHRFPVPFGERAHGTSHWNVNWSAKRKFIRRTVDFSLEMRSKMHKDATS
jgi:glycosyltransferase involved in cell wall biosynthesis